MKCCYCGKEINYYEKYDTFSVDGDFIHEECKKPQQSEMDKVLNMSKNEFEHWLAD